MSSDLSSSDLPQLPWYREMTRYHWFVFITCTLGWTFTGFDQQLLEPTTCFLLLGWAVGGIGFGILGDKYGRSRILPWTILLYSMSTGLSTLGAPLLFQFLAGVGLGGQFAVGVALVAETMPERVRPYALGTLFLFSVFGSMEAVVFSYPVWGLFPAVFVYFVIRYLDEPEKWKLAVRDEDGGNKNAGSYHELFGPVYGRCAVLGMILASVCVIGLWSIEVFSVALYRNVGCRLAVERLKAEGTTDIDFAMIAYLVRYPQIADDTLGLDPKTLFGNEKNNGDARYLFEAIRELRKRKKPKITDQSVAEEAINRWNLAEGNGRQTSAIPLNEVERRRTVFLERIQYGAAHYRDLPKEPTSGQELWQMRKHQLADYLRQIDKRTKLIEIEAESWDAMILPLTNIGAVFGIFSFIMITINLGWRATFTIFLSTATFLVIGVFMFAQTQWQIYVLATLMGFCLPSLFGGCAIYLPELFPTRIRSTAIAVCYGTGFFLAACIPLVCVVLTKYVYAGCDEPIRWAGATMSGVFPIGIAAVWMLQETKGKPLPE